MQEGEVVGWGGGEIGVLGSVGRDQVSSECHLAHPPPVPGWRLLTPGLFSSQVKVHYKPRVALLSTGSELIDLSLSTPVSDFTTPPPLPPRPNADGIPSDPSPASKSAPSWTGIYDSNRPALKAVIESMGWEVVDLGVVKDE